jgi:hypothetical protein
VVERGTLRGASFVVEKGFVRGVIKFDTLHKLPYFVFGCSEGED